MLMFYSCDYRKKMVQIQKNPTKALNTRQSVKLLSPFSKNSFGLKAVLVNNIKLLDLFHQRLTFQCNCHIGLLSILRYLTSRALKLFARLNQLLFAPLAALVVQPAASSALSSRAGAAVVVL